MIIFYKELICSSIKSHK